MTTNIEFAAAGRRNDWNPDADSGAPPHTRSVNALIERAAASLRYEAYVADGIGGGECEIDPRPTPPTPTEAIHNPVLFRRQSNDAAAIDMQDVKQGGLNDCFLLATLGALANSPEGRSLIQSAITENKNAAGAVTSYTVRLHKPEWHWGGLGKTTFKDIDVTVDATYITDHARVRDDHGTPEVWPLVMEKAYAQYLGGYGKLESGGVARDAMRVLTGKPATQIGLGLFTSYRADRLQSDLAAGKLITFATEEGIEVDAEDHYLISNHAYVVTGTEMVDGKLCVTLHNPWGHLDPSPVPVGDIKRWFVAVDVGSVK
jgi:hypothetical protein